MSVPGALTPIRVLRVYHSAVVAAWRERDRVMRKLGIDETLVSPRRWNEGGADVAFTPDGDDFVVAARTWGRHPYLFVYDPRVIRQFLRSRTFDVIDVHEEPGSLAAAQLFALRRLYRAARRSCCTRRRTSLAGCPCPSSGCDATRVAQGAAAVYCVNRAAAENLRGAASPGGSSCSGSESRRASFAPASLRAAPGNRVGYVGRLEPHKGVDVLLRAVHAVPTAELTIVGAGPVEDDLRKLSAELGISGRVTFTGFVPAGELPAVYQGFDVVVVPSLPTPTWIEQFCRVAVEAMAAGVPVVASDLGSLPEVVGDGGALVPPGDVDALANALRGLLGDADRWRQLRVRATAQAARFDWDAIAAQHVALYEAVVS